MTGLALANQVQSPVEREELLQAKNDRTVSINVSGGDFGGPSVVTIAVKPRSTVSTEAPAPASTWTLSPSPYL
jgi:hypothetical protein